MKIIKTTEYIKRAEVYLFDAITKFLLETSKELGPSEELESIRKDSFEIFKLEKQIIDKAKTQSNVSEGQDYYGGDYIAQRLAGMDLGETYDLSIKLDNGDIEDVANSVAAYKQRLQKLLKELTNRFI